MSSRSARSHVRVLILATVQDTSFRSTHMNLHTHESITRLPSLRVPSSYPSLFHSYIRISTRAKAYVRPRPQLRLRPAHMCSPFFAGMRALSRAGSGTHIHTANASMNYLSVRGLRFRRSRIFRGDERFTGMHDIARELR